MSTADVKSTIEDFGEKIGGARKDLWAGRNLTREDLGAMTDREVVALVSKDQIWPKPDYKALVADGMSAEAAYMVRLIRNLLPASPPDKSREGAAEYIAYVEWFRDSSLALAVMPTLFSGQDFSSMLTVEELKPFERVLFHRNKQCVKFRREVFSQRLREKAIRAVDSTIWPEEMPPNLRSVKFYRSRSRASGPFMGEERWKLQLPWSKKLRIEDPDAARIARDEGFVTKEEAVEFAKRHVSAVGEEKARKPAEPRRPYLSDVRRAGFNWRGGRNVREDDFQEAFGFRGGEFGNWLSEAERQESLNHAYDALHDLAWVLDVPSRALSHFGRLGLAFGARGHGGRQAALAHYEPTRTVINLTKLKGAGALAHEWGHSLDDFLGMAGGFGRIDKPYMSEALRGREHAARGHSDWDVVADVVEAIRYRVVSGDDLTSVKIPETETRLADAHANLSAWLNHMVTSLRLPAGTEPGTPPEVGLAVAACKDHPSEETAQKAFAACKAATGRLPEAKTRQAVDAWVRCIRVEERALEKMLNGEAEPEKRSTDYLRESLRIDRECRSKPYWGTGRELFARAFEAYVSDRLQAAGFRSEYLVSGVDNALYSLHKPYPEGAEREAINAAFDKLFSVLRERPVMVEGQRVRLFSGQSPDQDQDLVQEEESAPAA